MSITDTGAVDNSMLGEYAPANTPRPRPRGSETYSVQLPGEFEIQNPTVFTPRDGDPITKNFITVEIKGAKIAGGDFDNFPLQDFRFSSEKRTDKKSGKTYDGVRDFLIGTGSDPQTVIAADDETLVGLVQSKAGALVQVRLSYTGRTKDTATGRNLYIYYSRKGGAGKLPVNADGSVNRVVFKDNGSYVAEKSGASDSDKVYVDLGPDFRGFMAR